MVLSGGFRSVITAQGGRIINVSTGQPVGLPSGTHNQLPQGNAPPAFLGTEALLGSAVTLTRRVGAISAKAFSLQQKRAAIGLDFLIGAQDVLFDPILGYISAIDPTPGNIASNALVALDFARRGVQSLAAWGLHQQAAGFNKLAQWLW